MGPWPTVLVDVEQAQMLADDAVIAFGGLFLLLQILIELGLGGKAVP